MFHRRLLHIPPLFPVSIIAACAMLARFVSAQDAAPADRNAVNTAARPGGMMADSPVRFPANGALPSKYPPDRSARTNEAPEKDYYIFRTPERSLAQIEKIQAEMPAGEFTRPTNDWRHLQRTRRILTEGGDLRLLALGDSIVNDTMRSGWVAKLQEAYPRARIQATVYVRGGGGCQHYREEGRVAKNIVPRKPGLVLIGGISQKSVADIREVIHQLRAGLPDVEILLATGTFGTADPRAAAALAKAPHSGTGQYGEALRKLADEERCAFLDMTSPWAEYIRSSKLHPHLFYRDIVHANEFGEQILAKILMAFWAPTPRADTGSNITPAAWLALQTKPQFKPGHTLPPLTRFGWTLPFDARVELAEHWGYALEFGGYATEKQVEKDLADSNSIPSRLCALTASSPKKYPLAVIVSRDLPKQVPPETWARDAEGRPLDAKAQSMDGNVWDERKTVWSPEAPDSVWVQAGELRANPLRRIRERCPIAVVLNGGEYALGVLGFVRPVWEKDPRILKAKRDRSWFDYISERKAHQEMIISEAVRKAVPDRLLYSFYTSGGGTHRNRIANWQDWCWAYETMKRVSDLPSNEGYYRSFNDGWTGANDMLTLALNATALEIAHGQPLSYNWLCGGWTRDNLKDDGGLGDLSRYAGFLKCYYTAGMIGGNAGYYAYPKGGFGLSFPADQPPHWLRQMAVLAHVHALFTHLEPFLRQGDLLPGPNKHRISKNLPAYEFTSGDKDVRVLARKLKTKPEWLVTAWAAAGPDREVKVNIPSLGDLTLRARGRGATYHVQSTEGKPTFTLLDPDGLLPTKQVPSL